MSLKVPERERERESESERERERRDTQQQPQDPIIMSSWEGVALVVDNGSHTVKLSLSSSLSPLLFPNSVASSKRYTQQSFIGPQLSSLSSSLPSLSSSFTWKSPSEKGSRFPFQRKRKRNP